MARRYRVAKNSRTRGRMRRGGGIKRRYAAGGPALQNRQGPGQNPTVSRNGNGTRRIHRHAYSRDVARHWGQYPSDNLHLDYQPGSSGGYHHRHRRLGVPGPSQRHRHPFNSTPRGGHHGSLSTTQQHQGRHMPAPYVSTSQWRHHHNNGNGGGTRPRPIGGRMRRGGRPIGRMRRGGRVRRRR